MSKPFSIHTLWAFQTTTFSKQHSAMVPWSNSCIHKWYELCRKTQAIHLLNSNGSEERQKILPSALPYQEATTFCVWLAWLSRAQATSPPSSVDSNNPTASNSIFAVTKTSTQSSFSILDLQALREKSRKNFLDKFNVILWQELETFIASCNFPCLCLSQHIITLTNKQYKPLLHPVFERSSMKCSRKNLTLCMQKSKNLRTRLPCCADSINEMQMSINLLYQQILNCHKQITLFKQSPRGKRCGHL